MRRERAALLALALTALVPMALSAQAGPPVAPEVVAAVYIRDQKYSAGRVFFDDRIAPTSRDTAGGRAVMRHRAALTDVAVRLLRAPRADIDSVVHCESGLRRCRIDESRAIIWMSRAHVVGAQAIVLVNTMEAGNPETSKGLFSAGYEVTLSFVAGAWTVASVRVSGIS
ncbi:MAG: hypothetical protein IPP90_08270 [Gemmatimonadaceae bacterium]|nr:hypothetical protein [Gemmatimonadaceae bacterium]